MGIIWPRYTAFTTLPIDIIQVARKAGVSTATVSRVLNRSGKVRQSTADRVEAAIRDLHYKPNTNARTLRSGRSNMYGLLVSDVRNPFFPDLIEQFESLATDQGIDVTIVNTAYSEERMHAGISRLLERKVDGLAILTSEVSTSSIQTIRRARVPVVFLNQPSLSREFCTVLTDYMRGFHEAVEHLCMLGHRRIGYVAGPATQSSSVRRKQAFLAAMAAHDVSFDKDLLFSGDHKLTGGEFAAERIFSMKKPPTAVICSNDMMAVGLLHRANRLGRSIPRELSLIGFDGLFLCEIVHPPLTTMHFSRHDLATRVFNALQAISAGAPERQTSVITPRLVVRSSTAPPNNDEG